MTIIKKSDSPKPLNDNFECGYGKPPKDKQFKKGVSGNPSGRPKKDIKFKSLSRMVRDNFLREVKVTVNGKPCKMRMMEAVIAKLEMNALQGNVQAAKLLLALGAKHIPDNLTIQELMEGREIFEWTPEDIERFSKENILKGPEEAVGLDDVGDEPDEKPVL
jgi:hypothetical protein